MSVLVLHIKLFLLIFMFIKVQIEKSSKNVKVDKIFLNEQKTLSIVFTLCSQVPIPCTLIQWWAKSNHDSIQSRFERFESERFESQRRFDSNIVRFDSSTMRFDTDSIQILRFDSRDTRFEQKSRRHGWNWILILITHYSVRSYLQMFGFIITDVTPQ